MITHDLSRPLSLVLLIVGAALTGLACGGGDITTPDTGSIAVTTVTTGPEPDADGYAVAIDDGAEIAIPASGTMQRDNLELGNHSIRLSRMAANCTVAGENPRSVSVSAGATVEVSFAVTCTARTGILQITTTTTGGSPDPDGYTSAIDEGAAQAIGTNGALSIAVSPGTHRVILSGVASNCRVEGDNPRPISVTTGATTTAAFQITCSSPPVLKIAFIDNANPERDVTSVYLVNPDGNGTRRLTHDRDYMGLSWSPDGLKIATASHDPTDEDRFDVYVVNVDGSGITNLTNNPGEVGGCPAWSPDGRKIAFSGKVDNTSGIYVMNPDGSGKTKLPQGEGCPRWSPDGSKVAFIGGESSNPDIHVMNADGSGLTNLTATTEWKRNLDWSPDGRRIVYTGFRIGDLTHNIFVTNVNGTGETIVSQLPEPSGGYGWGGAGEPLWSPDGNHIAFTACVIRDCDTFIVNADGSGQQDLTNTPTNHEEVLGWSPDGSQILFWSDGVWVMRSDGTGRTVVSQAVPAWLAMAIWWR